MNKTNLVDAFHTALPQDCDPMMRTVTMPTDTNHAGVFPAAMAASIKAIKDKYPK
jgi:hypothetical protein